MAVDAMASRYGLLPSEIMSRASTFDLFVYDTAVSYIQYAQDKAEGKSPEYKQEDLLKMLKGKDKQ